MNIFLISVLDSVVRVTAPPVDLGPARISARYWRLDNLVFESSLTEIRGMSFVKRNSNLSTGWAVIPATVTTNIGVRPAGFNISKNITGGISITVIDSWTYVEFDFTTAQAPESLCVYINEPDVDYLVSCDISYSDDAVSWTLAGSYINPHNNHLLSADGFDLFSAPVPPPAGRIGISGASTYIVSGRSPAKLIIPRAEVLVLSGRHPSKAVISTSATYVITTPV